jgi:hypothetical protein
MPTALIKITQGAITDVPGRALKGVLATDDVVFSNGDDTGVVSWKYELLYVPPGSAIALTTQGPGINPTFNMGPPDQEGSYRVRLTVADASGLEDVDIRVFTVPLPGIGFIAPPYQGLPLPLPREGPGAKPDELNFAGQPYGWDGNDDTSHKLLYQALKSIDLMVSGATPPVTDGALTLFNGTSGIVLKESGVLDDGAENLSGITSLAIGIAPAASGAGKAIRLTLNESVYAKGSGGDFSVVGTSGDNVVLGSNSANQDDVFIDSDSAHGTTIRTGGLARLSIGTASVDISNRLQIGSLPATSGAIGLTNNQFIYARNSGVLNARLLGLNSSNDLLLGGNVVGLINVEIGVPSGGFMYFREGGVVALAVDNALVSSQASVFEVRPGGTTLRLQVNSTGFAFDGKTASAPETYTITNPVTNRSLNVLTASISTTKEVLGTLILDLAAKGILRP